MPLRDGFQSSKLHAWIQPLIMENILDLLVRVMFNAKCPRNSEDLRNDFGR
jgi:hypothetical protein